MTKYIDAELLRKEIEKNKNMIDGLFTEGDDSVYDGENDAYNRVLRIIDSLQQEQQEEPDKSLEEAAEISFDEAGALAEDYRDFLAKGLTENKPRPIGPHWFCEYAKNRFIVGAEWQKEQMLKNAVEGEVMTNGFYPYEPRIVAPYPNCPYAFGDNVRIVVLKAEEE